MDIQGGGGLNWFFWIVVFHLEVTFGSVVYVGILLWRYDVSVTLTPRKHRIQVG